jgi:hypothetical protein
MFERAAIVTSHDDDAVSACRALDPRDVSFRVAARDADRVPRAMRIFIEKNRLFCARAVTVPVDCEVFARSRFESRACERAACDAEKSHQKNFQNFFDARAFVTQKRASKRLASR